jgi:molybdopterin-guanine dinucleotide biosynthesis protein A
MPENEYVPHPLAPHVTAFVLTGGRSVRMGQDKALLRLRDGETFLEHAIATCGAVAGQVGIVGPRSRYGAYAWAGEIVEDIYPDRGPLGGIHAALSMTKTDWNLCLAVDLPAVNATLLRWLLGRARSAGKLICVPEVGGQQQPLCAVYRGGFREVAEVALKNNRNKVNGSFPPEETRVIAESEIVAAGFDPKMFANVNTPEEFAEFGR